MRSGAYEIVLANSPGAIPEAMRAVSDSMRITEDVFGPYVRFWQQHYPNDSFILPHFNNDQMQANDPIMIGYQPGDPSQMFIPGLEAHGELPQPGQLVQRDITVVASTQDIKDGHRVSYDGVTLGDDPSEKVWELVEMDLLPVLVVGFTDNRSAGENSDYILPVSEVRRGTTGTDLHRISQQLVAA